MRRISGFLLALFFSCSIFLYQGYLAVNRNSQGEESQITTLIHKVPYEDTDDLAAINPAEKIEFTINARYDNLGSVAIKFNNPNFKQGTDSTIVFRIKENGSDQWYYQNEYLLRQISSAEFYPFGFSPIAESQGKIYVVEVEYRGTKNSPALSLDEDAQNIIAKYDYSKPYLLGHKKEVPLFLLNRVTSIMSYIPRGEIGRWLFVSVLPFIVYLYFFFQLTLIRYEKWTSLAIFVATFAVAGYFSSINIDPHHDGIMLKPALDVARGKILFQETFAQYGALTVMIQAAAIKIFGEYLLTIKLLTAFFYALTGVTLYALSKKILPSFLAVPTFIIWLFMAPYYTWIFLPWSSVYALFFQMISAYFLLIFLETKKLKYLILGSALTGIIFWVRQPVGVFTLLAIVAYFVFSYITRQITRKALIMNLSIFLMSIVAVAAIFVGLIALTSSVHDWYKQSIELAFWFAKSTGGGFNLAFIFRSLLPPGWSPIPVWSFVPLSAFLILISQYKDRRISLLVFVGLAAWMQYYPVSCIRHQYWGATPLLPLSILFVYKFVRTYFAHHLWKKKIVSIVTVSLLAVFFLPEMAYRLLNGMTKFVTTYAQVEQPAILEGMRLSKEEAAFVNSMSTNIDDFFENNPEGNVITTSPHALYLTFDDRIRNIHPMYVSWKLVNDTVYPGYTEMISVYIDRERPLVVHLDGEIPQSYCPVSITNEYNDMRLAEPCR